MPSTSEPLQPGYEAPTEKLREVIAGWIDTVTTQGERAIESLGLRGTGKPWIPSVDVFENPEQVVVLVDLPGVDPAQVDIVLVGNMLTIRGEQAPCFHQSGKSVQRHERPSGAFSRSIPLPAPVNPERVSADSKHGVLTVTLAKEERAKPRPIPITVNAPAS
jgi:HSP20 family protein